MYKIFIVEDDDVIAELILKGLNKWGFEARICENLRNVCEEFIEFDPQLVLMDISLPFSTDITGAVKSESFQKYQSCSYLRQMKI